MTKTNVIDDIFIGTVWNSECFQSCLRKYLELYQMKNDQHDIILKVQDTVILTMTEYGETLITKCSWMNRKLAQYKVWKSKKKLESEKKKLGDITKSLNGMTYNNYFIGDIIEDRSLLCKM